MGKLSRSKQFRIFRIQKKYFELKYKKKYFELKSKYSKLKWGFGVEQEFPIFIKLSDNDKENLKKFDLEHIHTWYKIIDPIMEIGFNLIPTLVVHSKSSPNLHWVLFSEISRYWSYWYTSKIRLCQIDIERVKQLIFH